MQHLLKGVIWNLWTRGEVHDASKLVSPEVEKFDEFTPKLAEMEYGTDEYKAALSVMGVALEHHYEHNSHHPEHYEHGIADMTLCDLIEMLVDWKAASERMRKQMPASPGRAEAPKYDNSILRSIELNQERFGYSDEMKSILTATAKSWGWN